MLDDVKRAELDQSKAYLSEALPEMYSELYKGLKKKFPEDKAWELLKVYVFSISGGKGVSY